jgi:hypothetical protein
LDIQVALGEILTGTVMGGLNLKFLQSKNFDLGLAPKIGIFGSSIDFGTVKVIPGYTPPVITTTYTFYEGDSLQALLNPMA